MAKTVTKRLSQEVLHSHVYDSSLATKDPNQAQEHIAAVTKRVAELTNALSSSYETNFFSDLPQAYVERVGSNDLPILFHEAQKAFESGNYGESISKIDSILLRSNYGLEEKLRVDSLFLKSQCLFELGHYHFVLDVLSHIHANYISLLSSEDKMLCKFLLGKTCMQLNDYRKAYDFFDAIILMKDTMTHDQFETVFNISDYAYVLLADSDCMINHIGLADGKLGYAPVAYLLEEAKDILHTSFDIHNKKTLEDRLGQLQLSLNAHLWRQG